MVQAKDKMLIFIGLVCLFGGFFLINDSGLLSSVTGALTANATNVTNITQAAA